MKPSPRRALMHYAARLAHICHGIGIQYLKPSDGCEPIPVTTLISEFEHHESAPTAEEAQLAGQLQDAGEALAAAQRAPTHRKAFPLCVECRYRSDNGDCHASSKYNHELQRIEYRTCLEAREREDLCGLRARWFQPKIS